MKITLKKPIPSGSETLTELTLREEIVAGDMRDIELGRMVFGDIVKLASRLSGQPESVLDKMSSQDLVQVTNAVTDFLGVGRGTTAG